MRIYLAAPWFSPEQEIIHNKVLRALDSTDHKTFAPRRELVVQPDDPEIIRRRAFSGNLEAIERSELIVAITDYKDIGTIWEAGYAYRCIKPILYYAETLGDRPFNLMLAQSGIGVVRDTVELLDILKATNINRVVELCKSYHFGGPVE